MDWFSWENFNRKPELFSHEDHGAFRLNISQENQSIDDIILLNLSIVIEQLTWMYTFTPQITPSSG